MKLIYDKVICEYYYIYEEKPIPLVISIYVGMSSVPMFTIKEYLIDSDEII